jgi:hypothetical protein
LFAIARFERGLEGAEFFGVHGAFKGIGSECASQQITGATTFLSIPRHFALVRDLLNYLCRLTISHGWYSATIRI